MSDIIVRFKPMGQKRLIDAIKRLDNAQKGNTATTTKQTAATKRQTKANAGLLNSQRLLNTSFATFRSHMLLASFAMSLGIRQTIKFAKQAASIQQMEDAFNDMSAGSNNATIAISKLQRATNNTLSEFDLFQQANNAMVLGLTRNADEMADMFDMAQRLGDALGKDVKLSIESLVTGIGRQSRLMLDNIGIIVKADKAYTDYAREIGKTADALTDSEKKQAFMNAALEAGRQKLKVLPEETLNANKVMQQFTASMANLAVRIGDEALPVIISTAKFMAKLADSFNSKRVEAYAKVIKVSLAGALIFYRKQVMAAVSAQMKLGWGALIVAAGVLAESIFRIGGAFKDTVVEIPKLTDGIATFLENLKSKNIDQLNASLAEQKQKYSDLNPELIAMADRLNNLNILIAIEESAVERNSQKIAKLKREREELNDTLDAGTGELRRLTKGQMEQVDEIRNSIVTIQDYINILKFGFSSVNNFGESQAIANDMYKKTTQSQIEVNQQSQNMINNLIEQEKATTNNEETLRKYNAVLEFLTNQRISLNKKEGKSEFDLARLKEQTISSSIKAMGNIVGMSEKNAKATAAIMAAAAIVDAYSGAQKAWKNTLDAGLLTPFPEIAYAAALATGLVNARQVAMSANGLGGGSSGGGGGVYGKFEHGGYVGGRPHSQGGTIIEAERGEFVMSRNAVESIGLETLNQMNQSGGGGNINVNVSGNVLTQDFVEGELAESIKEAVRRGSDFGIG